MPVPLRGQKTGQTPFFGGKCTPPPVKASPSPVCLRRPVSLRDASSAPRAKNGTDSFFWREEHPAASKGFAFASLLAQASIASRCQFRFAGKKRDRLHLFRKRPPFAVHRPRRALRAEDPSFVLRPRSWTRPLKEQKSGTRSDARVQGRLSLHVILAIS
jgi:hypothetical protein